MRTYPSARRAIAAILAAVAIVLGIVIIVLPGYLDIGFILGATDILLGVAIILGIVVIRSGYD